MAINNNELVDMIKKRQGEQVLKDYARSLGVSQGYLYDVYAGNRPVGPRLSKAVGFSRVKTTVIRFKKVAA